MLKNVINGCSDWCLINKYIENSYNYLYIVFSFIFWKPSRLDSSSYFKLKFRIEFLFSLSSFQYKWMSNNLKFNHL